MKSSFDMVNPFDPLSDDHPLVVEGKLCEGCRAVFQAGDVTCLVPIEPSEGNSNVWLAAPWHWKCYLEAIYSLPAPSNGRHAHG